MFAVWVALLVVLSPSTPEEPAVASTVVFTVGFLGIFLLLGVSLWRLVSPVRWAEPFECCGRHGRHSFRCPTQPPLSKREWVGNVLYLAVFGILNAFFDGDDD
jgi:hypothetical protein